MVLGPLDLWTSVRKLAVLKEVSDDNASVSYIDGDVDGTEGCW